MRKHHLVICLHTSPQQLGWRLDSTFLGGRHSGSPSAINLVARQADTLGCIGGGQVISRTGSNEPNEQIYCKIYSSSTSSWRPTRECHTHILYKILHSLCQRQEAYHRFNPIHSSGQLCVSPPKHSSPHCWKGYSSFVYSTLKN